MKKEEFEKQFGEQVRALKEDIIPWRKRNAQRIADIEARNLEADIKRKQAEMLEYVRGWL
jgi:hypothetical protein